MGRFILGVGIGGEDANEWWACGIDPKTRGRRTDESLAIMRSLWTNEKTTFDGKYYKLENVGMQPKPFRETGVTLTSAAAPTPRCNARRASATPGCRSGSRRAGCARRAKASAELATAGPRRGDDRKGIQLWHAVALDGDRDAAKERLARRMQGFYQIPYERFERYSPYGTPEEIAEFIMPYIEAGCTHLNLLAVQATRRKRSRRPRREGRAGEGRGDARAFRGEARVGETHRCVGGRGRAWRFLDVRAAVAHDSLLVADERGEAAHQGSG